MSLLLGLELFCGAKSGGVQEIHGASQDDLVSFTLGGDVYTAANMNGGAVFVKYVGQKNLSELRENGDGTSGSIIYTQQIEFFGKAISTTLRNSIMELVNESPCGMVFIVTLVDGTKWVVGYSESLKKNRPVELITDATLSGKALSDANGSTITLQAESTEKFREFTGVIPQ